MDLLRPQHWQEFETITRDAMAQKWSNPNLQKNGRSGQAQNGVDIFGADEIGRNVGIQCKRHQSPLKMSTIKEEIENAEGFEPPLTTLFIATTADHDAPLQQQVRKLSRDRAELGKFTVSILFWEDIVDGLKLNSKIFNVHYPNVVLDLDRPTPLSRQLSALELGYYSGYLNSYANSVMRGETDVSDLALEEIRGLLRILEHQAAICLSPEDTNAINGYVTVLRSEATGKWRNMKDLSAKVVQGLLFSASLIPFQEGKIIELAIHLGRLSFSDRWFRNPDAVDEMIRKILSVVSPSRRDYFQQKLKKFVSEIENFHEFSKSTYQLLRHEFRWSSPNE
jgi:hypothetical protein